MYAQTEWFDRVTEWENRFTEVDNPDGSISHIPYEGEVIQVGTPQNQTNFNNMENGIQDAHITARLVAFAQHQYVGEPDPTDDVSVAQLLFVFGNYHHQKQVDQEVEGEKITITLENSERQPFNSTIDNPKSVALTKVRSNRFYSVEAEVSYSDGLPGEIVISDKTLNGFKVAFTGSAKRIIMVLRVKGGMTGSDPVEAVLF